MESRALIVQLDTKDPAGMGGGVTRGHSGCFSSLLVVGLSQAHSEDTVTWKDV